MCCTWKCERLDLWLWRELSPKLLPMGHPLVVTIVFLLGNEIA